MVRELSVLQKKLSNYKSIAIITARGGSKRIPKKNIKEFCGKPIIAYSIKAAIDSKIFDEVMVSTDSKEIAEIAKKYGASVPFMRSEELSGDNATTDDTLLEVLNEYKTMGKEFTYMCCLYPTAPFVTPQKLKSAMTIMQEKNPEQIVPMVSYSFPPQRSNYIDENGYAQYVFPESKMTRSQDLDKWYHDAGQFYVYNVKKFFKCNGDCTEIIPFIVPEMEVQDIDNISDWKIAEIKYMILNETRQEMLNMGDENI